MNFPNLITLSRIPLMLVVIGFLFLDAENAPPWSRTIALCVFLFAAMTDWLDGWMARKMGQVSDFGKFMDALSDKVLTLGMFVSFLALQIVDRWALFPVLLILSRELLITGLRLVASGKGVTLAAEKVGKVKTVVQIVCISLFLIEITLLDDLWNLLPKDFREPLHEFVSTAADASLLLATVLTVFSGIVYLCKHWAILTENEA